MFQENNKSFQVRKMLLKAFGKCVSPYYYYLSIQEAKKLLPQEHKTCINLEIKPIKTLGIV